MYKLFFFVNFYKLIGYMYNYYIIQTRPGSISILTHKPKSSPYFSINHDPPTYTPFNPHIPLTHNNIYLHSLASEKDARMRPRAVNCAGVNAGSAYYTTRCDDSPRTPTCRFIYIVRAGAVSARIRSARIYTAETIYISTGSSKLGLYMKSAY